MAMASIDNLAPTRSLIDLTNTDIGDIGIDDYELNFIFNDILPLAEFNNSREFVQSILLVAAKPALTILLGNLTSNTLLRSKLSRDAFCIIIF